MTILRRIRRWRAERREYCWLRTVLLTLCLPLTLTASGQSAADHIIGNYLAKLSHNDAYVKVFKYQGGYRMQIFDLKEKRHPDGTLKCDDKNPDPNKRKTPMTEVVLIDHVTYEDGLWKNGHIYDPAHGKTYRVELRFKDSKTLEVKGKLGPFYKCMYWTKY